MEESLTKQWYDSRHKAISAVQHISNDKVEIRATWMAILKEDLKTMSMTGISEKWKISRYSVVKDVSNFEMFDSNDDRLINTRGLSFDERKAYEIVSQHVEMKNGVPVFKRVSSRRSLNRIGTEVMDQMDCRKMKLSRRQLIWILEKKEFPQGRIMSHGGDAIENLYLANDDLTGKTGRMEDVVINGKQYRFAVESSSVDQPDTPANHLRMKGICYMCKHYIDRCLEYEMELECLLTEESLEELTQQHAEKFAEIR